MDKKTTTEAVFSGIGAIVAFVGLFFYQMFVILKVWNFVSPILHLTPITSMWQSYALVCIFNALHIGGHMYKQDTTNLGALLARAYGGLTFVWFLTYFLYK